MRTESNEEKLHGNIIIGHFNINSLRNKFSSIKKFCQSLDLTITNEAVRWQFPKSSVLNKWL